jgi:GPH family glycoside/pentoside/hexuronide:cation symporter
VANASTRQANAVPPSRPPGYVGAVPFSLKAGWGVGAFGSLGMLWMVNVFLMFFLVNHLGMNAALAGIILFITRIYDVISDPLIGHLSDNSSSRWGRRRPWMFVGAFASGLAAIFTFNVPAFSSENATAVYQLIVLLVYFTGFTLFYVPFMAMPAEMTDDYNERTSIMSFRVGYSFAAGMIIAAGMPALIARLGGDRAAYEFAAVIAGILITTSMLMTVLFTAKARELPRAPRERYSAREYLTSLLRNRPFFSLAALKFTVFLGAAINGSASLFFMTYVMERAEMGQAFYSLMSNIAGLCALPLWTRLSRGRDKKRVYLLAVLGSAVLAASWALATPEESNFIFGLRSFLMGAFGAGGLIMGFSMLPDTIEYDRLTTGLERAGLYTGLLGFIEKNAAAIAPMITGFLFAAMGIVETSTGNVEQPESAISAIVAAKAWIPAAFNLVAAAVLLTYRLSEEQLTTLRLQATGR